MAPVQRAEQALIGSGHDLVLSPAATTCDVSLSIYSSRETINELSRSVECAAHGASLQTTLDVVVNGNSALAHMLTKRAGNQLKIPAGVRLRIWNVAMGDKACAWNQFVHKIAPVAQTYVFVDGYARIDRDSVAGLNSILLANPDALGATGLPRSGRSAKKMGAILAVEGGLHGNLYALSARAMRELQRIGFRLPLGLYRTDPTLGAALSFGLNLYPRQWAPQKRIVLAPSSGWEITPLRWWRWADLVTHRRRFLRQAQGELEIAAIREHFAVRRLSFESLGQTAHEMVATWVKRCPDESARLLASSRKLRRAYAQMSEPRDWSLAQQPPVIYWDSDKGRL